MLVGTNHRHAPIGVREELAAHDHGRELLIELTASAAVAEAVGLSTCNRCEIAMVGADADAMREAAVERPRPTAGHAAERLEPLLYVHRGELAAHHLFAVAGGLDSMVPGEAQILAQIRDAYAVARTSGHDRPGLQPALPPGARGRASACATRRRSARAAPRWPRSPPSWCASGWVTAGGRRVLIVGAGKVAELVAANLHCPRRPQDHGGQPQPRPGRGAGRRGSAAAPSTGADLPAAIAAADVVVSSTPRRAT